MARQAARYSRRHASRLLAAALGVGLASACDQAARAPRGNRIVPTPAPSAVDEKLIPRAWNTTTITIGAGFNSLTALHFIQNLQVPRPSVPYVASMTFYAPRELPLVTIGVYYEKDGASQATRELLTSSALRLQPIADLDEPLAWELDQTDVLAEKLPSEQLAWFVDHRWAIVESMRTSAQGAALSKKYDCDFTSRLRPSNTSAALVVAGGTYSGLQLPDTIIAQRLVFVA